MHTQAIQQPVMYLFKKHTTPALVILWLDVYPQQRSVVMVMALFQHLVVAIDLQKNGIHQQAAAKHAPSRMLVIMPVVGG